jgi:sulfur-carrier protein
VKVLRILYFAWVRERIGKSEENLEPPASAATVKDLIAWLSSRGEEYALAFESRA